MTFTAAPGTWQNAACGVLAAPRNTGRPTMPSRPTVATSTGTRSSAMPTMENTDASGKYTSGIAPPG